MASSFALESNACALERRRTAAARKRPVRTIEWVLIGMLHLSNTDATCSLGSDEWKMGSGLVCHVPSILRPERRETSWCGSPTTASRPARTRIVLSRAQAESMRPKLSSPHPPEIGEPSCRIPHTLKCETLLEGYNRRTGSPRPPRGGLSARRAGILFLPRMAGRTGCLDLLGALPAGVEQNPPAAAP